MDRIEWVREQLPAAPGDRRGVRADAAVRRSDDRHRHPSRAEDRRAAAHAAARRRASVVATGNLNSTQPEAVDLPPRARRDVVGAPTTRPGRARRATCRGRRARGPTAARQRRRPVRPLPRGSRGTACAAAPRRRRRAACGSSRCATRLGVPVLVINDSPIKQFAENEHAVGQSVLESFLRITNRSTNGRRVTVFGYGACGKGVAATSATRTRSCRSSRSTR